jgi:hypothetical protein
MLAKSLSFLADADAAGIVLGARVPIILTSRADSVTDAPGLLRGGGARGQGAARRPAEGGGVMADVMATRSSSSTRARRASSSRSSPRTAPTWSRTQRRPGRGLVHRAALRRQGRRRRASRARLWTRGPARPRGRSSTSVTSCASESRATAWPASATASCTAASTTRAGARGRAVVEDAAQFVPLAPLHQPHNLAPIRALLSARPESAAGGLLRHRLPPRAARAGADVRAAAGASRRRRAALRLPRPVLRVHRLGAAGLDPRAPAGRTVVLHLGNGASMCALRAAAASPARWASPRSTACRWARAAAPRPRRHAVPDGPARHGRAGHREADLPAVGPARRVGRVERHAHTAGERRAAGRARRVDLFVYRIGRELGSLAAALGGLDAFVFTAGIGENAGAGPRARLPRTCRLARRGARRRAAAANQPHRHVLEHLVEPDLHVQRREHQRAGAVAGGEQPVVGGQAAEDLEAARSGSISTYSCRLSSIR